MDLKTWMKKNRWSAHKMGQEIHMNGSVLSDIANKYRRPGVQSITKIVEFTGGEVSYDELYVPDYQVITCPCCGKKTLPGLIEKGIEKRRAREEKVPA